MKKALEIALLSAALAFSSSSTAFSQNAADALPKPSSSSDVSARKSKPFIPSIMHVLMTLDGKKIVTEYTSENSEDITAEYEKDEKGADGFYFGKLKSNKGLLSGSNTYVPPEIKIRFNKFESPSFLGFLLNGSRYFDFTIKYSTGDWQVTGDYDVFGSDSTGLYVAKLSKHKFDSIGKQSVSLESSVATSDIQKDDGEQ